MNAEEHGTESRTALAAGSTAVISALAALWLYFRAGAAVYTYVSAAVIALCAAAGVLYLRAAEKDRIKPLFITAAALCLTVCVNYLNLALEYGEAMELCGRCAGKAEKITAVVENVNYSTDYSFSADVTVKEIGGSECYFGGRFTADRYCDLSEDDCFSFYGGIEKTGTGGEYFSGKYLLSKGIYARVSPEEGSEIEYLGFVGGRGIKDFFEKISLRFADRLVFSCGKEEGALASALLLGKKDMLPDSLKADLRVLGMSHIAAVSGLHMSILVGTADMLLKKRVKPAARGIISVILSLLVMLLAGCSPSVTRCAVMNITVFALASAGIRISAVSALALSAGIIGMINPFALFDVGLILSACATLGITTLGAKAGKYADKLYMKDNLSGRTAGAAVTLVSAAFCAQLFTLPVIYFIYGSVSVIAPIANLVFVPLASLILLTAPFVIISGGVPVLSALSVFPLKAECMIFADLARILSVRQFNVRTDTFLAPAIAAAFVGAAVASRVIRRGGILPARYAAIPYIGAALSLCAAAVITGNAYGGERMYYITEGKNDCVIFASGGDYTAVDISDGSDFIFDCAERANEDYRCGGRHTLVLTHCHLRHISNICRMLDYNYLDCLVLPSPLNEDDETVITALEKAAAAAGCDTVRYDAENESAVSGGGIVLSIPPRTYIPRSTHPVICFSALFDGNNVLYCGGSVFESGQREYAGKAASESGVMIFGIHSPVIKENISDLISPVNGGAVIAADEGVRDSLGMAGDIVYPGENGEICVRFE